MTGYGSFFERVWLATRDRQADADIRLLLLIALTLFGAITVASIKPVFWYSLDGHLLSWLGGNWILFDASWFALAALIVVALSLRVLPAAKWPWPFLLHWGPVAAWSLASATWAIKPQITISTWFYEAALSMLVMILGYAVGYRRLYIADVAKAGFLIVAVYVATRSLLVAHCLDWSESTTWFSLIHAFLLLWLLESCESDRPHSTMLVLSLIVALQVFLHLQIPQRMYVFSLFVSTVTAAVAFAVLKLEPAETVRWRNSVAVVLVCLGLLCVIQFSTKSASSLLPGSSQDPLYLVFIRSERYTIFQYWISQGIDNAWFGVGLHWWNPLAKYYSALAQTGLPPGIITHAHNYFLNVWLQLGLVGLLLQTYLLAAVTKAALGNFPSADIGSRRLAVTYCISLLACFSRNMSDDGLHAGALLLFWLLSGFVVGHQFAHKNGMAPNRDKESC